MGKGISLHIGLNRVSPAHYGRWDGRLNACVSDAEAMAAIATARGFTAHRLHDDAATRDAVRGKLRELAPQLAAGDILLLSYSGHGGSIGDASGDEPDGLDETWCLYDGQLIDDELYQLFSAFAPAVRIAVFSDSCHSGTVTKDTEELEHPELVRAMPLDVVARVYREHRAFYDGLQADIPDDIQQAVKASVLLVSGCQDDQTSLDGPFNGAFTSTLLRVWDNGGFTDDYKAFHRAIASRMPDTQTPNLYELGVGSFADQRPFTI
jgi:metacaspase-1